MNALELADTMEKEMVDGFCLGYIGDAVAMLRQQQAEIEALKKEAALQRLFDFTQESEKTLTDEEIEELSEEHLDMDWQTGVIEFARAILRKAQEK
jgi:hypothetical protein